MAIDPRSVISALRVAIPETVKASVAHFKDLADGWRGADGSTASAAPHPESPRSGLAAASPFAVLGRRPTGFERPGERDVLGEVSFWLSAGLFLVFIAWINIGTLDVVSMTTGEVIPSTQVKAIQHLEGGIVLEILVREGQQVSKEQPLVVLEGTSSGADVAELKVRLSALQVDILRLEAEAAGGELRFNREMTAAHPALTAQAMERYQVRKQAQDSKVRSQQQSIRQRQNEIKEIQARVVRNREALSFLEDQIKISTDLLKDSLTSRYDHLDLQRRRSELKGSVEMDAASLERARAALEESDEQLLSIKSSYLAEVRDELDRTRLDFNELTERNKKFEDSLRRTVLRSPVDGIVKTLYVTTIGGVIKSGDKVVDIVPADDRLVIESKLPTQDIGYVHVGQKAIVNLTSSDAARYGHLIGTVTHVSPDAQLSPEGMPFYKVRIETDKSYFERGPHRYQLFPGMQLAANIRTGERTVFQYLFDPWISSMSFAMQER